MSETDCVLKEFGNCSYYETGCSDCKVKAKIRNALSAQPKQRWIPVSETIDIPDHEILACDKYGELMFGYLAYMDDQWLCESDGDIMYDPTAWREKPEPYREDG